MARWLHSGLRRDLCVAVAALDSPSESNVKRTLERRYETRIRPKTFHGALDALESQGFVERTVDGVHERVSLTERGRTGLRSQYEWLSDALDD